MSNPRPMRCPNCGQVAEVISGPKDERTYEVLVQHINPICPFKIASYHHTQKEAVLKFNELMSLRSRGVEEERV